MSANRVRDVHVILSGALGIAARWGWIPFNPALMARPAGGKGKSRPVPTPQQARELFGALADEPDFAVFLPLRTTAWLRPSEVCALRWLDLDLDAATVSINGSVVTAKSLSQKYARKNPKSVHGERLLALDAATVELLHAHRGRCEQLAEQFGGRLESQAYVCARTPDGRTPLRPDTVSKRFTALVRRLGNDYTLCGCASRCSPNACTRLCRTPTWPGCPVLTRLRAAKAATSSKTMPAPLCFRAGIPARSLVLALFRASMSGPSADGRHSQKRRHADEVRKRPGAEPAADGRVAGLVAWRYTPRSAWHPVHRPSRRQGCQPGI